MANEQKIDEIISPEAFRQLDELLNKLGIASNKFNDMANAATNANAAIAKSKSVQELSANIENTSKAMAHMEQAEKQFIKTNDDFNSTLAKATGLVNAQIGTISGNVKALMSLKAELASVNESIKNYAKNGDVASSRVQALLIRQNELKVAISAQNITLRQAVKEAQAAEGSYASLSATLLRLKNGFQALNETERNNPMIGGVYANAIQETDAKLKALDATQGVHNRNVGNYTNFVGKAWGAVRQLAYLLPGVGVAGLIGFATEPIIEYIKELDIFKKKIGEVAAAGGAVSTEYKKAVSDVTALGTSLNEFKSGVISRDEVVKRFNETIGQTVGELKTVGQVEDFYNQKSAAFVQATLLRAQAQAALNVATEKNSQALKRQSEGTTLGDLGKSILNDFKILFTGGPVKNPIDYLNEDIIRLKKEGKEAVVEYQKLQQEADAFAKKNNLNFRTQKGPSKNPVDTTLKSYAQAAKDVAKEIYDDESLSYEVRFSALESYLSASRDVVNEDAKVKIDKSKKTKTELSNIEAERLREAEKAQRDYTGKVADLTDKFNKQQVKDATDAQKKEVLTIKQSLDDRLLIVESNRAKQEQIVSEAFVKGELTEKQYNKRLYEIDLQASKDRLRLQIDNMRELIATQKNYLDVGIGSEEEYANNLKRLAELQMKYSKMGTDAEVKNAKDLFEEKKKIRDKEIELAQEIANATFSILNSSSERRMQALEAENEAVQKKREQDIEAVNESVLTEQEKEDKIAIINAQADAKQQIIEDRKKQEEIRRAKFEKAQAISSIVMNTAVAIMRTYATGLGFFSQPLAVLQAAIGAVQLAAVMAQPIPKYKDGTDYHPQDGFAIVGDGGMSELTVSPSGKIQLSPDRPTLTYLEKGSKVYDGEETLKRLKNWPVKPPKLDVGTTSRNSDVALLNGLKRIEKAIASQKQYGTILTPRGLKGYMASQKNIDNWLDRNGLRRR